MEPVERPSDQRVVEVAHGRGVQVGDGNWQQNLLGLIQPVQGAVSWPVQVGLPPRRAGAFQARRDLISRVWGAFETSGSAVLSQVVAAGDGGVGKTQLAAAVFRQARDEGFDMLLWVNATSRDSILTTFARACAAAGAVTGASVEAAAEGFLEWLAATSRSWLVVLDDIADPAHLDGLWPDDSRGRVLITTRRRDIGRGIEVPVGVFSAVEAVTYLTDKLTAATTGNALEGVLADADQLAEDLGHLPVALAQAGALIATEAITCRDYRARFADKANQLARLFPAHAHADDYRHTVATAWALAIEQANNLPPAGLARPALEMAAVLDPNGAPEDLWTTQAILDHICTQLAGENPDITTEAPTNEDMRAALRNLHRLSLITHDPNAGAQAVRAHALVQRAVIDTLTPEQIEATIRAAADALVEFWPDPENDPALSQVLRKNTDTLTHHPASHILWQPDSHLVLFGAGNSLGETGQVSQAVTYFEQFHNTVLRLLGPDHRDTLTIRHNIAYWRGEAGDAQRAVTAFEALLSDRLRVLGPDHPDTLSTRHNLARWRGEAGDAQGAVTAFEHLLTDQLRVLGPDHPDTLSARHNLASWRGEAGDAQGAVTAFEALLSDRLRVLGPDHPNTLTTRQEIAYWRGEAGDAQGAVTAFEALLSERLPVLGPDHPHTLSTRSNLASSRGRAGDTQGAVTAFEHLLTDRLRVLGPDHPNTLSTRHNLAHWRGRAGDPQGAVTAFEHLLTDQLRVLGPDHPHTLSTRHNLASWQGEAGDAQGAVTALKQLLTDQLRVLGPDHPKTLTTRQVIAYWQRQAR